MYDTTITGTNSEEVYHLEEHVTATVRPNNNITGVKQPDENFLPKEYELSQNYPNPFNPATTINYQLPKTSDVTLKVYDVLGREVKALVNERQSPGKYSVTFHTETLTSGIYFYRLCAGDYSSTKKLMLLK